MNKPTPEFSLLAFWWMPRRTDPLKPGWYYVREVTPRLCIGIRYFDDSNQTWWAFNSAIRDLVPNETFHDWLCIPNIADRTGNAHDPTGLL